MNNILKIAVCSAIVASAANTAHAVSPELGFNIKATVPSTSFYVQPVNAYTGTVLMPWDAQRLAITPHNNQLKMKNSTGGIKAYLLDQPQLVGSASSTNIPLTVTINNQSLQVGSGNTVELLARADAASEKTLGMTVAQAATYTDANRPAPGDYYGTITAVFDSVP